MAAISAPSIFLKHEIKFAPRRIRYRPRAARAWAPARRPSDAPPQSRPIAALVTEVRCLIELRSQTSLLRRAKTNEPCARQANHDPQASLLVSEVSPRPRCRLLIDPTINIGFTQPRAAIALFSLTDSPVKSCHSPRRTPAFRAGCRHCHAPRRQRSPGIDLVSRTGSANSMVVFSHGHARTTINHVTASPMGTPENFPAVMPTARPAAPAITKPNAPPRRISQATMLRISTTAMMMMADIE